MTELPDGTTLCAFLALELPKETQEECAREILRLEQEIPGVEWMNSRRLHLTIRFLGWTNSDRLKCLEPYLLKAASACPPFAAKISGLGTFPATASKARVLFAGIDVPRAAKTLQAACEAAAIECGFPPERREFVAHLTLGRFASGARQRVTSRLKLGSIRVENFVMCRTQPNKGEPTVPGVRRPVTTYATLATYPLG